MSWYDDKPVYYDKRPGLVKLPHDSLVKDPDKLAKLSGDVVTYKIGEVKNHDRDSSRSQTFGRIDGKSGATRRLQPAHCK